MTRKAAFVAGLGAFALFYFAGLAGSKPPNRTDSPLFYLMIPAVGYTLFAAARFGETTGRKLLNVLGAIGLLFVEMLVCAGIAMLIFGGTS